MNQLSVDEHQVSNNNRLSAASLLTTSPYDVTAQLFPNPTEALNNIHLLIQSTLQFLSL